MKILLRSRKNLKAAKRWDIDYHLPPEGIKQFSSNLLKRVDSVAEISKIKRDPRGEPHEVFRYVDISSVDVSTGVIVNPQELEGIEAPSRARKVVSAFDIVISTCRPTRGAIAVVPLELHNQIASTGFTVIRPLDGVNPFYLHYALRLSSTLEQFRKFSTGSSYPAILDSDVAKTLIPVPNEERQDSIAFTVLSSLKERNKIIVEANRIWTSTLSEITNSLCNEETLPNDLKLFDESISNDYSAKGIQLVLNSLPPIDS